MKKAIPDEKRCFRCRVNPRRETKRKKKDGTVEVTLHHRCLKCWRARRFEKKNDVGSGLLIRESFGSAEAREAVAFVQRKLKPCDFSGVNVFVALKPSKSKTTGVTAAFTFPPKPRGSEGTNWKPWMEVRLMVRSDAVFPLTERLTTATTQVKDKVALALMGGDNWFYEYQDVTFRNSAELMVYAMGFGLFSVLRKLQLFPGRATKVGMTKTGVDWMEEFAKWRDLPESEKHRPLKAEAIKPGAGLDPEQQNAAKKAWVTIRAKKEARMAALAGR